MHREKRSQNRLSIKNIDPLLEEEEMINLTVNVDSNGDNGESSGNNNGGKS